MYSCINCPSRREPLSRVVYSARWVWKLPTIGSCSFDATYIAANPTGPGVVR